MSQLNFEIYIQRRSYQDRVPELEKKNRLQCYGTPTGEVVFKKADLVKKVLVKFEGPDEFGVDNRKHGYARVEKTSRVHRVTALDPFELFYFQEKSLDLVLLVKI